MLWQRALPYTLGTRSAPTSRPARKCSRSPCIVLSYARLPSAEIRLSKVILEMWVNFQDSNGTIAQRMGYATGAHFTAIAPFVAVIMVERIDRLNPALRSEERRVGKEC